MQVVQVLLDAEMPLTVLDIRDRTKWLAGSVIAKILRRMLNAGYVTGSGHYGTKFELRAERRDEVQRTFEIFSLVNSEPQPLPVEAKDVPKDGLVS